MLRELARIIDPDFGQDIVACGFVKDLAADAGSGAVSFALELTTPACPIKDEFERKARNYVAALDWVTQVGLVGPLACMRATTSSAPRFGHCRRAWNLRQVLRAPGLGSGTERRGMVSATICLGPLQGIPWGGGGDGYIFYALGCVWHLCAWGIVYAYEGFPRLD